MVLIRKSETSRGGGALNKNPILPLKEKIRCTAFRSQLFFKEKGLLYHFKYLSSFN